MCVSSKYTEHDTVAFSTCLYVYPCTIAHTYVFVDLKHKMRPFIFLFQFLFLNVCVAVCGLEASRRSFDLSQASYGFNWLGNNYIVGGENDGGRSERMQRGKER